MQFDYVDFLSFVGGLLGFFAGFSALSLVELIYWFAIKAFAHAVHYKVTKNRVEPLEMDGTDDENKHRFEIIVEYFQSSSIHGLNYFTNTNYAEKFEVCRNEH